MSPRQQLHLVEGGLSQEQRLYRLREPKARQAPAEETWPPSGEWLTLIRRLMRDPKPG